MKLASLLICLLLLFDNTLLTIKTNETPLLKLKRSIDSGMLGGVPHPSSSVLKKMHQSSQACSRFFEHFYQSPEYQKRVY